MIFSTLTGKAIVSHQLQNSLRNISAQYQLDKASSQAKDTQIKSLEDLVIEMGHDPKDIKATEQLIKRKNDDIVALKKQLKIPQLQRPQTQDVLEIQTKHEELMDWVLKLNDQLKETEKELDTLIQLKQSDISTPSANVIPTVSIAVPSTLATLLDSTTPMPTSQPVSTQSTSAAGASGEEAANLVRAMEKMSIQDT